MTNWGSQDWVISKIRNFRHLLWGVPEAALAKYNTIDPLIRMTFAQRTTANVINSLMIDEARKQFAGVPGSEFLDTNQTTYHLLNGCALWYKQLGSDGLPSNYPTELARELMSGSFDFAPQRLLLVLGFQFDETYQKLKLVQIQRYQSSNFCKFYIELEKFTPKSQVIEMPTQVSDAVATRTRVRIKRGPEQTELLAQEGE
ncbi:hypothetical protein [Occallatibacter savannae]|uniref:hypothetical protein n=1 Tax=Occallatibacter savannae TaxID=1002691 RepID=UPI000D69C74C|nr:hypothetical protein [Occallatibacter savannae]